MVDKISFFSGMNTENDLLPADLAKDLIQIINALADKYNNASNFVGPSLQQLKSHIVDYHNPHKLNTLSGLNASLISTIYTYYKNFYNTDDDSDILSLTDFTKAITNDPISLLELLRRIQLNCFRWVDGYTAINASNYALKNYYTNDAITNRVSHYGAPSYSASRDGSLRDYPYLERLSIFDGTYNIIPKLKDYFLYQQSASVRDPSYGLSYDMNSAVTLGWDERYIDNLSKGLWSLIVTPTNIGIFVKPYYSDGKYNINVILTTIDKDSFYISPIADKTFYIESSIPKCVITFGVNDLAYITTLDKGSLKTTTIDYPYQDYGLYHTGKVYTSVVLDKDVYPVSILDPDITGYYPNGFYPKVDLPEGMSLLELDYNTIPNTNGGYIPDSNYTIERLS